jgi:hypothetical protein
MLGLTLVILVWALLIALFFVVLPYLGCRIYAKQLGRCMPFTHRWHVTHVTAPMWDMSSKGELWRCENCDKVRAL